MLIAVDFDGTLVDDSHPYDDLKTPLTFLPGAREALLSLKAAGHVLILWSGRASACLHTNPADDIWIRSGIKTVRSQASWNASLLVKRARYAQMLGFVARELPDVFTVIDDGTGGKPPADMFIDDKAVRLGTGAWAVGWARIAEVFGDADATAVSA